MLFFTISGQSMVKLWLNPKKRLNSWILKENSMYADPTTVVNEDIWRTSGARQILL